MQQGFTIIARIVGFRCWRIADPTSRLQGFDAGASLTLLSTLGACAPAGPTFSPQDLRLAGLEPRPPGAALTRVSWRAYLKTPPRRQYERTRSRPTPPLHRHAVEMSLALLLCPVMSEEVRPVEQPRNLLNRQFSSILSLLNPERLYIEMFNSPCSLPHDNAFRCRAVRQELEVTGQPHFQTNIPKGQSFGRACAYRMKFSFARR